MNGDAPNEEEHPLQRGIDEGSVRPAQSVRPVGHHPLEPASREVLDVLDEDRDD